MVKVSIIVPIYNVEKYLAKCLESLVNQTIDSYELILVNDGSTDGSQVIVNEYVTKYPDIIKSYYKTNGGLSSARNHGMKYVTGEYIGFVDSDDWVLPDMFKLMYYNAKNNGSDIGCCGYTEIFSDRENHHIPRYMGYKNCRYKIEVVSWNKIYKTDFLKKNNLVFLVGVLHEDFDFTTRSLSLTSKVSFIDDYLYIYNRLNQNSITTSGGGMNSSSCAKILQNLFLWRANNGIKDKEFDHYMFCWVYDYLMVYEKSIGQKKIFIRSNFLNIFKVSGFSLKTLVKMSLMLI